MAYMSDKNRDDSSFWWGFAFGGAFTAFLIGVGGLVLMALV